MCSDDRAPGDWRLSRRTLTGLLLAGAFGGDAAAATGEHSVTIATPDGHADAVIHMPAKGKRGPAILMWTDIYGLRPAFRIIGRRLAAEGYVVLTPNPYYRIAPTPVLGAPVDLTDADQRQKLIAMAQTLNPRTTATDATAFFHYLERVPQVDRSRPAGVHGYCLGGPLMIWTAAALPDRVRAGASFHGARMVDPSLDSPSRFIPRTQAEALVLGAGDDDRREPAANAELRRAYVEAHLPAKVEVYAGARHGWCVPGNPTYDHGLAEQAWVELLDLYGRALS